MAGERAATMRGILFSILVYAVALAAVVFVAFKISPWPSALLIRRAFTKEADRISAGLEKHLPTNVAERLNERYAPDSRDAVLDVFFPSALQNSTALPTIVWVHGGAWISGTKDQIANYAKILAAKNFTVVSVGYSLAPRAKYPSPVRQVNAALGYLQVNAARLHIDPTRFFLAGDSGGAHIVAQVANAITVPSYASALGITPALERPRLRGTILFCGAYDTHHLNLDGPFGGFLRTVLWSYSGSRDFKNDPRFAGASVIDYVTKDFPPAFISAGNGDPLLSQSLAFADRLESLGVRNERLFFLANREPPLPHEYQFNLDDEAGRLALARVAAFASTH